MKEENTRVSIIPEVAENIGRVHHRALALEMAV